MSDDEDDEEPKSWADRLEENLALWICIAVIGASVAVPVALWAATTFFGWEPPEFVQEWIDFFAA